MAHWNRRPPTTAPAKTSARSTANLFKVGDEVEAEVINLDVNERKIALSIRALRKTEERQEMENYLNREKEGGRFSFESILNEELRLDRDEEGGQQGRKNKGGNP